MENDLPSEGENVDSADQRGHFVYDPETDTFTAEAPNGAITVARGQCLLSGEHCTGCVKGMNRLGDIPVITHAAERGFIGHEHLQKLLELGRLTVAECVCDAQKRYDEKRKTA